jgi:hypothetical protein
MQSLEREKREWWVISAGVVRPLVGYSCAPVNPRVWWFPELGESLTEGFHIFKTRREATVKAIEIEGDLISKSSHRLAELLLSVKAVAS